MTYWVTSDTHLGHDKVFEFEPDRTSFEKTIKHIDCVRPEDILIHCGDIGFYDTMMIHRYIHKCKGKFILIKGNHDDKSYSWYYDRGVGFICESLELILFGRKIVFSHHPLDVKCLNIHGHLHRTKNNYMSEYPFYSDNHILVTTENDCKPVNVEKLIGGKP